MDLLVIFLLIVSYKVSGSRLEVNNDLLNDVGSLEVQGYEVHEKLSDRKEHQGLPHFVTTTNHRRSSSSQESDGSSSSGRTGEQKISVADNIGAYETSGRAVASGNLVVGKEVINIVNRKTNSHATPYNSVLSDSIKHSIGDDATFTHKPIIVRSLTLSEVDNGSHRTLPEEHYTGRQLSQGVPNVNEEALSASSPPALRAQHNINSNSTTYRETVRQPYSSSGFQEATGSVENNGSPFSRVDERTTVLHTTVSPKMLVDHTPTSGIPYDTAVVGIQRGIQGEYSRNNENVNEEGLSVSYPVSMKVQHNIDSDTIRYRETVRQPYFTSSGSQVETGFAENNSSPYSSVEENKAVLHTTVFPKVLVHQNPTSVTHDITPAIDVKRGIQGEYSRNDENHPSLGSRVDTGFAEDNGSPYSGVEDKEAVLHTKLSPKVLVHQNPTSITHDITLAIDVKRGIQGEYSRNDENHPSLGSRVDTGFAEDNGSPYSGVQDKEAVLHTTLSPKILVHQNPTSVTHDITPAIDVKRGTHGDYSGNDGNQDMFKTKKSLSNSMLSSGTQHYLDHSATGDRVNQFPSQPQYILDQNIFERYPSSNGEYFFNHNGFPHPFLSTQFGLESYNSRPSYTFHHQPTLHHVEHSLRSPSKKGSSTVLEQDDVALSRGISNHNLYFPPSPDNGEFSFSGIPFIRPPPSILSYPREEAELGISEGIFSQLV